MRAGGGKSKGASFERDICRQLSLWVSAGANEDCFWRSAMSGGRSTVAHRKGKRLAAQAGDITAIHPLGQPLTDLFVIECKHYRDLDLRGLFSLKGKLVQFWQEVSKQASRYEKWPLLIAKQNNLPAFVCSRTHRTKHIWWGDPMLVSYPLEMEIRWLDAVLKFDPLLDAS